jgi:hypothetical protein
MPVVALQNQKVETLRKKVISLVKSTPAPQAAKQALLAKVASMTKAELIAELKSVAPQAKVQAKVQAKAQSQAKSQKKRTSVKAQTRKSQTGARGTNQSRKGGRKTKSGGARLVKIPQELRLRAGKIQRAIKSGKIAVKQGKASPSAFPLQDARDRYTAFAALYSDARITRKSRTSTKSRKARKTRKSVKQVFVQIQGQKMPYMIKKSKRIPTRVAAVPGQGAKPFNQLSLAQQQSVVAFLNSDKAKKLREKGAPRKVKFQDVKRKSEKTRSKKTQTQTKPQGGSNYHR